MATPTTPIPTICGKTVQGNPRTLVDLLQRHAAATATSPADAANTTASAISSGFSWIDDGGNVARKLTYADLEREARVVAQGLQANKAHGQRVLLIFEPGLDFVVGFFGCVYAGAIAVPVYPPLKDEDFFKLDGLVIDSEARFMLTTSVVHKGLQRKLLNPLARGGYALKKLLPIAIDLLDRTASSWTPPDISPASPAYLQYTSGSTAFPKGVVVTHENAVYNAVAISHLLDTQAPQQLGLCWLPLYHDMGLVGNVLSVLYSRMPMMLMAPSTFLKRPDMFLRLVAQHRVTHVAAPNFAYELCARKLSDAAARQLDLSHLRVALNGAEQVQASTLRRFCDKFGPSGFTMDKFYACYGLAEATLIVTGGQQGVPPTFLASPASGAKEERVRPSDMLVACGTSLPEGEIRIVDPVSRTACPPLSVGEVWARGPGISPGYYGQPDRTQEVFAAAVEGDASSACYMRTGDLGFVNEKGELFVTGRLKDLIIVRGRNVYPLDIEWTIHSASDLVRPGCCAVFSVQLEGHDEEKVVAVAELRQPVADAKARDDLVLSIKTAVARAFDGLELHDVVLVKEHTVPKTSSGKLMRFACRYSYLQASLARLDSNTSSGTGGRNLVGGVVDKLVQAFKPRKEALQRYIVNKVAEAVDLDAANIDPACDVRSYGMDSLRQMQLLRELEDRLGCALPTSLCDEYNSIEQIVDLLLSDAYTKISPRLTKFIDEELAAFKPEKRRQRRKGGFELKSALQSNGTSASSDSVAEAQAKEEEDDEALPEVDVAALAQPVVPTLEDYPGAPIAIVGMACRVPKARNVGEFWSNLDSGVDAISQIPADRWNAEAFYDPDMDKPGKMPTTQGGFLDDVDKFDASFFHIGAREAEVMDPQQRMVLEVVYEALEDAGMSLDKVRGSRTGVFTGVCFSDYHKVQVADPDKIRPYVQTGCASSIVPNRVSYFYDLKGPSFTVDTACSSSLVALHLACESIQRGECDRAIVAGTSTNLLPEMFIAFAKLHMLSPNGRCKAFDASGDGYVRSEGICVLVIEPLATAARERDSVRALVRATGTNQDGRTAGLTFPGRDAQAALLREVYSRARLTPFDVQFIEAHGTGTRAGDPVEAGAIGSVLGEVRPGDNPLLIGSVKSNIGHLEGASGLAGVIKAVLAMEHGVIPANLHFQTPNPDIDFDGMRLKVTGTKTPWPACSVRRAGVNSFGFGGSNAHAVIEQAPLVPALALPAHHRRNERTPQAFPIVLSAHTKQALTDLQQAYAARLADTADGLGLADDAERLMDLAYTLACRRTHHGYRLSTVVSSAAELAAELPKAKIAKMPEADKAKQVLFVFTGQGAQWYAMGRQLLRDEPVFRDCMRECDRIVRRLVGWSVLEVLAQDEATTIVNRPDIAQPCTTSLQVSLVRLWRHWGVEPSIVVGHSSGEIATAYAAGALSLEDTIRTAVYRGEAMKVNESGRGKMAAVGMTEQEAAEFLAPYRGKVGIAAVNSPTNCTISGDAAEMEAIGEVLKERGVFCQFLRIDCAYHSHHMLPVGARLTELLTGLETQGGEQTRVPMISTVLGAPCKASDLGADYWVRNLVSMVRFWPAIEAAFRTTRIDVVVEIGPHPALQGPLRQCLLALSSQPPAVLPSIIRKEDEQRRMLLSLSALHDAGVDVAWDRVFRDKLLVGYREPRLVRGLPSFPWQRKSYWHESDISRQSRFRELGHELLGHRLHQAHGAALWQNELKVPHLPYLKDHVVQGSIVFPGAGYIAMAAAIPADDAKSAGSGDAVNTPVAIEEIVFKKALIFETDQTAIKTQLTLADKEEEGRRDFTVFSADGSGWQEHCSGKHRRLAPAAPAAADQVEANKALMQAVKERCPHFVSKDECYKVFNDAGLEYGPDFQGIEELHRGDGEAWAVVSSVPCALPPAGSSYAIHPTVLDACFQVLIGAVGGSLSESYLPVRIGKIEVHSPCRAAKYFVHATAKKPAQGSFVGDIRLLGLADGEDKVSVEGLLCASIGKKGGAKGGDEQGSWEWNESLYEFVWRPDLALLVHGADGLVAQAVPPTDAAWDDEPERVALAYLRRVAASFEASPEKRERIVPLYRPLYDWLEATVRATADQAAAENVPVEAFFSAEEEQALKDESLVVHRIGYHLEEILLGTTDPLSLLFKDDTVYRVYEKGPTFYQANQILGQALDLLAHKHGQLRVLEIGAGTGGTTTHALPVLGKRFVSYTFTDISPSFFEKAKAKFAPWGGRMKFQVLDIEKDLDAQGFTPESYDLIVATDVLHATVDIVQTLTSVRRLLAPGGQLLMNEFVNTPMWIQTVFGTLSGWWRFQDPERRSVGPTLSEQAWRQAFVDSGWAVIHPLHDRRPRPIHATFLATAPLAEPAAAATPVVYVLADAGEEQEAVVAELASLCAAAPRELVRVAAAGEAAAHGTLVYLPSLSSASVFEGVSDGEFERMKAAVSGHCGEVYWVTRGGNMDCPLPHNAPLVGFSRVMKNERPGIKSCVVDVDPRFTPAQVAASVFEALASPHVRDEEELVVRQGAAASERPVVYVPRVAAKKVSADLQRTEEKRYGDCAGLRLEVGTAGLLNTLQWRESQRRVPGPGEVEVQVQATGLNFKDVMLAMGMLSDEAVEGGFCGRNLGIECAGVVAAVGEGVADLAVGQRVVCVARYCFSTYVTTLAPLVQPIPEWMSFEEAATIPATFLTALYALKHLGHIQPGESVLIHAAAGGVGQAAIQLAHLFGAEVYATVGSREKREFIERELGVRPDRIMNSRSLDFVQELAKKTDGRGVDLVLNSLSGEALKKSVGVLAPFGRFLEIGKRDIYGNSKLDLLPFGQNLSFFAIDLDRLNGSHPHTSGRIFRELMALFHERKLRPLPRKVYSFGRVEEAFRYMQQGKHIGKVILSLRPDEPVRTLLPAFAFDPAPVYLLIGGLGGFGSAVARWMAQHGATNLAFLSRSGAATPAAAQAVEELTALGAHVLVEKADVVDRDQLQAALGRIRAHFPAAPGFGGVMQAAMVLDDCLLDDMTPDRFRRVVAPKVRGTHNLVELLGAEPLRFFVLFSSVSAVVGNLAQSNYAAANAYLDALAHQARARSPSLPLVSINWGAIGDVGYVAERKDLEESMKKRGIYPLPIDHALHVLQWAITDLPAQVVASPILWRVAANTLPSLTSARFRALLVDDRGEATDGGAGGGSSVSVFQQLSAAPAEERIEILRQSLRAKLSSMLGIAAEDIEMSNKLTDLGVDSLMAVELKNWIDKEMKISLSVLDLTGGKSIDELVVKILSLSSLAPSSSSSSSSSDATAISPSSAASSAAASGPVAVFECYRKVEKPKARLVCFPYLGGEPSVFRGWTAFVPADVELYAYVPQRSSTWEDLLPLILDQLALLDQAAPAPLVFYGHSMGGLIAYEAASHFRASSQLVVAAIASPDEPSIFATEWEGWSDAVLAAAPVEDFMRVAMQQGLIVNTTLDPEVIRSSILLGKRYLPWRKASGLYGEGQRKQMQSKLLAVGGEKDVIFKDKTHLLSWEHYTTAAFEFLSIAEGSHLFLNEEAAMANFVPALSAVLASAASSSSSS